MSELLKDLRRTETKVDGAIPTLPSFNDDVFHQTLENIEHQWVAIQKQSEVDLNPMSEELSLELTNNGITAELENTVIQNLRYIEVYHKARALCTYQQERMNRIRTIKWTTGSTRLPESISSSMSPAEQTWYKNHLDILNEFINKGRTKGLNLNSDLEPPNTSNIITVKCNENVGNVMLRNGVSVTLQQNMIYTFPRNVIEQFIRLGQLEPV